MDEPNKAAEPLGMPDLSRAIEGILAHPELIGAVAAALGKAPPSASEPAAPPVTEVAESAAPSVEAAAPPAPAPEALAALAPLLSGLSGGGIHGKEDSRTCLLRALKPYLSEGRCEAIDTIIRISALSELLRGRGGLGGGH